MKNILKNYQITDDRNNLKWLFLLFLGVFCAYANVFKCGFVFDDKILIVNNQNIKSFRYIFDIFSGEFFDIDMRFNKGGYYRPLIVFSYMLEYFIWKLSAAGYHIVNVTIHFANVCLLFYFLKIVFKKINIAFLTALFFGIHPVQTSAVTYISGRTDLMAFFFMLLFLLNGYHWFFNTYKIKYMYFSFVCYLMALLCKEVAIISFVLLFICVWYRDKFFYKLKKTYWFLIGCILTAMLYLFLRGLALNSFSVGGSVSIFDGIFVRLALIPSIILDYFKIIIFPFNLHFERFIALPQTAGEYMFSFKALFSYLVFALFLFAYYRYSKKFKILHFGFLFFFTAFFPGLQIVPIIISGKLFTPEHFLYIPIVSFFVVITYFSDRLFAKNNKYFKWIVFMLAVLCVVLSLKRNLIFRDNITFYSGTLSLSDGSARVYNNLGNAYSDKGLYKKAFEEYRKALKIDASYPQTYLNMGNLFVRQGLYDKSFTYYLKAVELKPNDHVLLCNIGVLYDKQKKHKRAVSYLKKAIALKPNYKEAYDNLGTVYLNMGDFQNALKAYLQAVNIDDNYGAVYYHIGNLYMRQGKHAEATMYFRKALDVSEPFYEAYNNLGIVLKRQGRADEAIKAYKEALKIMPDNINFLNNLGAVYDMIGEYEKSTIYFEKVCAINSRDVSAVYNLGNVFLRLRKYKKAKKYLEKAYSLAPKDKDIILSLSVLYQKTGQRNKAIDVLMKAKKIYPNNMEISSNLKYFLKN